MTLSDVKASYVSRLRELEAQARKERVRQLLAGTLVGVSLGAMGVVAVAALELRSVTLGIAAFLLLPITTYCARSYRIGSDALHHTARVQRLYDAGIGRLQDE